MRIPERASERTRCYVILLDVLNLVAISYSTTARNALVTSSCDWGSFSRRVALSSCLLLVTAISTLPCTQDTSYGIPTLRILFIRERPLL
jgi:hypothetical protein